MSRLGFGGQGAQAPVQYGPHFRGFTLYPPKFAETLSKRHTIGPDQGDAAMTVLDTFIQSISSAVEYNRDAPFTRTPSCANCAC